MKMDCFTKYNESEFNIVDVVNAISPSMKQDPFYVLNLDNIYDKYTSWLHTFPRVMPHYAVKCNGDKMMLKVLAYLGAGFDCASKSEIDSVLELGVAPDRIIFANPCKQASYIEYAREKGVDCMTFDNEDELIKIKKFYPNARLVLRIITDDRNAVCRFSMKFGADMPTSYKLIDLAFRLKLNLVGISFHVGSGQMSAEAFTEPIKNARLLFDYVEKTYSHKLSLLDLGGGFPGSPEQKELLSKIAVEINKSLETHFPDDGVKIIAEPGRYFPCSAFTLVVNVIARRVVPDNDTTIYYYYVNDGIFASFNCLIYDHVEEFPPILLKSINPDEKLYNTIVWGPTCDGMDLIVKNCKLPELQIGEYVAFTNMGSYTIAGSTPYNGIPLPETRYAISNECWEGKQLKNAFLN